MAAVLLDTHAWVWSFTNPKRLSAAANSAIDTADTVYVSPVSLYEIGQKVRFGKWPAMAPLVASLAEILSRQTCVVAPLTPEICLAAGLADWSHRDPFDRMLVFSARALRATLVSRDPVFRTLGSIECVW